jgi:flagellar M-ring protein FliF
VGDLLSIIIIMSVASILLSAGTYAVGFKEGRDAITVQNMLFQVDNQQLEELQVLKKEEREYATTIAFAFATALALALFFMFIVRPYIRWLSYDPQKKHDEKFIEEFNADRELGQHQNIQIQEDVPFEKLSPTEQVHYLAKHEPKRTTEAIRMMMNPHQPQG